MLNNGRMVLIEKVLLFVFLIFSILFCMISTDYLVLSLTSLIMLICIIMIVKKSGFSYLSFPVIFVIISYLFHMGNIVCTMLFYDGRFGNTFWGADDKYIIKACRFFVLSMCFLMIGITHKARIKIIGTKKLNYTVTDKQLLYTGAFLFVIGIIPKLTIDFNKLIIGLGHGYLEVYKIDMSGKGGLSTFVYTGVICIMLAKRKNENFCRWLLLLTVIYEGVMMLSGGRYTSMAMIITICFIYIKYIGKINLKKIIIYLILGIFLLTLMNTIREVRVSAVSASLFVNEYFIQLKNNPFIGLVMEMGGTMKSLVLSIQYFPSYSDYAYGSTYYEAALSTIPILSNSSFVDTNKLFFIYNFPNSKSLGGSYLGEAYYNFGFLGIVFSYFLGLFIGKVGRVFEEKEFRCNVILFVPIMMYSLMYIRGYIYSFKIAIYHIITILLLFYILKKYKR